VSVPVESLSWYAIFPLTLTFPISKIWTIIPTLFFNSRIHGKKNYKSSLKSANTMQRLSYVIIK
jgi:hypothetical protein